MENSKIEWTTHTMNFWTGCTAVSAACDHCYADALITRFGGNFAERKRTSQSNWMKALRWNKEACGAADRPRVFSNSLSDFFDNQVPAEWRNDAWQVIRGTPHLDWLLLTKRPQNIAEMLPPDWGAGYANVWLGTTVENQTEADRRIPHLLAVDAVVHFLSCEPLLGPVDLNSAAGGTRWIGGQRGHDGQHRGAGGADCPRFLHHHHDDRCRKGIDWVIVGGESGAHARPTQPGWMRSLRAQCAASNVAFLVKQWGEWAPYDRGRFATGVTDEPIQRFGKKLAGRMLDGVTHDGYPKAAQ